AVSGDRAPVIMPIRLGAGGAAGALSIDDLTVEFFSAGSSSDIDPLFELTPKHIDEMVEQQRTRERQQREEGHAAAEVAGNTDKDMDERIAGEAAEVRAAPSDLRSTSAAARPKRIMVVYRRADSGAVAGRIVDRLAAYYGKEALFLDARDIPVGVD